MDKKKGWLPVLAGVLVLILLASFFMKEQKPAPPVQTGPTAQNQTAPTGPVQATEPEGTLPRLDEATEPEDTAWPEQTEPVRTEPEQTEPEQNEPVQTEPPARSVFPAELEDGMLTVYSLFQFSGMNPDADNAFGDDIAGIELTNSSDRHMTFAEVTIILTDGTFLTFRAEDVPAGRTVMAFSIEHAPVKNLDDCEEIYGFAEYETGDVLLTDQVQCTANGARLTVKNLTGEELTDLEVTCHGLLDSSFFGGSTYRYNVSTLPAGASTVIYAEECILGMVEVVRVDRGG